MATYATNVVNVGSRSSSLGTSQSKVCRRCNLVYSTPQKGEKEDLLGELKQPGRAKVDDQ